MRVLVCGGRDYNNGVRVAEELNALMDAAGSLFVIEGGTPGADACASEWAVSRGEPTARFRAPWSAHGKVAGPIRNGWMLKYGQPDLVLAFPGGRGTANMVKQARAAGVEVKEIQDAR